MTTSQLKKLKDAGFTLDQIIVIGGIFDPEPPKPDAETLKQIYERQAREHKPPVRPRLTAADFGLPPDSVLLSGAAGGYTRAQALPPERRSEIARQAARKRWNSVTQDH